MLITEHLRRRLAGDGAAPLLTHYDLEAGSRTELSATSFANWVAKTATLALDELDLEPGEPVSLPLLRHHPGHWTSLVWVAALWQAGACVVVPAPSGSGPGGAATTRVAVVGPEEVSEPATVDAETVLACSLHPLGLGFDEPLPAGWLDASEESRPQPDQFGGPDPTPELPAWSSADAEDGDPVELDQRGLGDLPGDPARRLVRPGTPWPTVRTALVAPLLGGGSAVVVSGGDEAALSRIAAEERTD